MPLLVVKEERLISFQRWIRSQLQSVRHLWQEIRSAFLIAITCALAVGTVIFGATWFRAKEANNTIEALRSGRNVPVSEDAAPGLLLARIGFLSKRDEIDRARSLVDAIDQNDSNDLRAKAHYLLANAFLRKAFALLTHGDLEPAGPFVNLAKREYRRALQFVPEFWDAKFNLDVVSRLVRDYPELERMSGDELAADPKKIWTDIPGTPKGLP